MIKEKAVIAMANYVWHRIICTNSVLETYFIDNNPFGEEKPLAEPYISFNRFFGCKTLNDYYQQHGVYISYDMGSVWRGQNDGTVEIKFCTRWEYPIKAIIQVLELCKSELIWYACEENHNYVSRFQWTGDSIQEHILPLDDDYWDWDEETENRLQGRIEEGDYDDSIWYYLPLSKERWRIWPSNDGFLRYWKNAVVHIEKPDWCKLDYA
jgi:hypothetical protein